MDITVSSDCIKANDSNTVSMFVSLSNVEDVSIQPALSIFESAVEAVRDHVTETIRNLDLSEAGVEYGTGN